MGVENESVEVRVGILLKQRGYTVATAESCTGGGVAALLTSVSGSSAYVKGGIVAYTNEVKMRLLQVSPDTLAQFTAVSEQTVREMAQGVMRLLGTDCALAVSGIAGPGGGTDEIPVGTIWVAVACGTCIRTHRICEDHGRAANVQNAVQTALQMLEEQLKM